MSYPELFNDAGPRATSTVIIQTDRSIAPYHGRIMIAYILLESVPLWVVLRLAVRIGRLFRPPDLNITNRRFSLLLAAIAVETMANGLNQLLPVLSGA